MSNQKIKILLIGLGPHSKRIYISGLKKLGLEPTVVVDLESKKTEIIRFLDKIDIKCEILCLSDSLKDLRTLDPVFQKTLEEALTKHKITHVIVSTEPKAHYAYLKFLIPFGLHILTDKPITAPIGVIENEESLNLIQTDYNDLLLLSEKHKTSIWVQCQRRYDKRFQFIFSYLKELLQSHQVPISHIQINHCDGSLNMPDEFLYRENHPYKYGYGKLFHSGYHFIDLAAQLLTINHLIEQKTPNRAFLTSSHYSPQDQLFSLNEDVLEHLFFSDHYTEYFQLWKEGHYRNMGELDVLAQIEFLKDEHVITTCSLNLLQSGFSKRAWSHLPKDTYKGNGRVRHETLNLQVGPLANIQVHSYQAYEIKERNNDQINHTDIGGLEHFDIYIFRNSDLIGGKPLEIIKGKELLCQTLEDHPDFIGFNEHARHFLLKDFLNNQNSLSDLKSHSLTIQLMYELYKTIQLKRKGLPPFSNFTLGIQDDLSQLHRRVFM